MALELHAHLRLADNFIKYEAMQDPLNLPTVDAAWAWWPVTEVTTGVPDGEDTVREGPVYTFGVGTVTKTYNRRAMTPQELSDRADAQLDQEARLAIGKAFNDLHNLHLMAYRAAVPGGTLAQMNAALTTFKASANGISTEQTRAYLKGLL